LRRGKQRGMVRCGKTSSSLSLSRRMKHIVDYILVSNKQILRTTYFSLKCIPVLLFRCYVRLVVVLRNDCVNSTAEFFIHSADRAVPYTRHLMTASICQVRTSLSVKFCFSVNYLFRKNVLSSGMSCAGINTKLSSVITKFVIQLRLYCGSWSVFLKSGPSCTASEGTWRNWYSMLSDRPNHLRSLLCVQWQFFYSGLGLRSLLNLCTFSGQVV